MQVRDEIEKSTRLQLIIIIKLFSCQIIKGNPQIVVEYENIREKDLLIY